MSQPAVSTHSGFCTTCEHGFMEACAHRSGRRTRRRPRLRFRGGHHWKWGLHPRKVPSELQLEPHSPRYGPVMVCGPSWALVLCGGTYPPSHLVPQTGILNLPPPPPPQARLLAACPGPPSPCALGPPACCLPVARQKWESTPGPYQKVMQTKMLKWLHNPNPT